MIPKIRYRLVYNYASRLNRQGLAPVSVECRQGQKKMYVSSNILLYPYQWDKGRVINHDNADKMTAYLVKWRNSIEEIELDALLNGKGMSLYQLKDAIRTGTRASATIAEFVEAAINNSSRGKSTRQGYKYLANDIEKLYGKVTLSDITYDFIERYRAEMRKNNLSENTVKGRLKLLRCLMNEALKRNLIKEDPFKFITIGNMTGRVGGLNASEVRKIERLKLEGKEAIVRDLFCLSCYCGLRWSDLSTLEEATIENGILRKRMKKTNHDVFIPIGSLFYGKAKEIIDRYEDIRELSHVCCNTTANRMLKEIARKAGIKKKVYMHLGRKTCSSMLNALGMPLQDISMILGHVESRVTERHYLFNNNERLKTICGNIFKNKSKK